MKELVSIQRLREDMKSVLSTYKDRINAPGAITEHRLCQALGDNALDPAMYNPHQPESHEYSHWDQITDVHRECGQKLIEQGSVAVVVLAGGASTRVGHSKCLSALPHADMSLLTWKLLNCVGVPTWIMASPSSFQETCDAVSCLSTVNSYGIVFEQFESYRLTNESALKFLSPGVPDMYPTGHGDLGPALVASGIFDDCSNVKYVCVCNADNVLATLDPGMVGFHASNKQAITCEVVEKNPGDRGGVPAIVKGKLQIAETFRLPFDFFPQSKYLNTNSMIIDVPVLQSVIDWRWHRVIKKSVDQAPVVQYERLIQQYTECFSTTMLVVPREKRFFCVKEEKDFEGAGQLIASLKRT